MSARCKVSSEIGLVSDKGSVHIGGFILVGCTDSALVSH